MDDEKYYLEQLYQQTFLLVDACRNYDNGNFFYAKSMSAIIRTLVKDSEAPSKSKNQSISLLKSLGVKESMNFYNTGFEVADPNMNINLVGFVTVPAKVPAVNNSFDNFYLPVLDNSERIDCKWLKFEDWWNSQIIVSKTDKRNIIFTRKKITMSMAEQDGGVHVDALERVDKDYRDIALSISHIFIHMGPQGEVPIEYLQYALVRQISHELIKSILKKFSLGLDYHPTNKINLRGVSETKIVQPGIFAEENKCVSTRTKNPYKEPPYITIKTPPNAAYVRLSYK